MRTDSYYENQMRFAEEEFNYQRKKLAEDNNSVSISVTYKHLVAAYEEYKRVKPLYEAFISGVETERGTKVDT